MLTLNSKAKCDHAVQNTFYQFVVECSILEHMRSRISRSMLILERNLDMIMLHINYDISNCIRRLGEFNSLESVTRVEL